MAALLKTEGILAVGAGESLRIDRFADETDPEADSYCFSRKKRNK